MKTTLCMTCVFGLVREEDCGDETCMEKHFINKCLLGDDYPGNIITACTKYKKKSKPKVTYHDPDYEEYEARVNENKEMKKELKDISQDKECTECSQSDTGQTGEHPCTECGLPLTHDEVDGVIVSVDGVDIDDPVPDGG